MQNKTGTMETIRAYKFRIYPDAKRQWEINNAVSLSQKLYNLLLEKTIEAHKKNPSSKISQKTINQFLNEIIKEDKTYLQLYAHVRVDIRNKLLRTYQNFFRRCKERKQGRKVKVGFPRFKSNDKYNSITHLENNGSFGIEKSGRKNMLRISKIGRVQIEQHRQIDGRIKTLTIKKEGKDYYAIFTAEQTASPATLKDTNPIGIDLGLNNFIAMSDGTTIQKPKFYKKHEKRIKWWQRSLSRRKKGSKRREKAKRHLQNEWNEATRASDDFMHKLSNRLVRQGYTSFATENLNIQNMQKNHRLAQSIANASWSRFVNYLSCKAESAGMEVTEVPSRDTTRMCSSCGTKKEMPLKEREYVCGNCGLHMDSDINAAINILNRATLEQRERCAQGDAGQYSATGAANSVEELRTYPAIAGEAPNL